MKQILRTTILAAVLAVFGGCQSVKSPAWYSDAWRGFPFQEAKEKLDGYNQVLLVCVTADHGEKLEIEVSGFKKPGGYLHHYTATGVKNYKGNFKVGDRLTFVEGCCPCGGEQKITTNSFVGDLTFLLVEDKVNTGTEFGIDPFDTEPYDPLTDRLFTYVFGGCVIERRGF